MVKLKGNDNYLNIDSCVALINLVNKCNLLIVGGYNSVTERFINNLITDSILFDSQLIIEIFPYFSKRNTFKFEGEYIGLSINYLQIEKKTKLKETALC